jgi:hypothetical protein
MKKISIILVVLLVGSYIGNYPVLSLLYPKHEIDYYVFLDFYKVRNIMYSVMFCAFFLVLAINTNGISKALSKFAFILSFGSFFDQTFLNVNDYLRSDILLIMIAFEISIFQYLFYDRKVRRGV